MTKRDDGKFVRREKDYYPTPLVAVIPLLPHLTRMKIRTFVEPCAGVERRLTKHLVSHGLRCIANGDITDTPGRDASDPGDWQREDYDGVDAVITNPPWEAKVMHAIMQHQCIVRPAWFLIYSDWLFTKQSAHIMHHFCTDIVPIGRIKWIEDSDSVGFDNCCWVCMNSNKDHPVVFWPIIK